ncbi:metallophosphoesterase 1 isoform X3 [Nycticebus coucang]|uniref:metallophosphoesterase 1 isoform X3 n=1 Tax=Nycticebus coucang TaxID=9470 RepID=UPI00234CD99F|nr:metallophosphoesterase 1 isoform X3 [Nycticebus coucang]
MAVIRLGFGRQNSPLLKRRSSLLLKLIAVVFAVLLFCEFLVYYLVIFRCDWPAVTTPAHGSKPAPLAPVLKAMFLADTHLLGEVRGHWLDKLRRMTAYKIKRFEKIFSSERLFSWKGINFVMINSVALEGDRCILCSKAEAELIAISHRLNCSREQDPASHLCGEGQPLPVSAPVLLQHYPLYRRSDENCSGEDAAPLEERNIPFQERYDVLSQEASQKLLWWLRPRLVLSGHTHSGCEVLHPGGITELSVPSFSWRNRNNPSFIMGSITSTGHALSKCSLPREDMVLATYCGAAGFLAVLLLAHFELLASPFFFGWNLLRKPRTM